MSTTLNNLTGSGGPSPASLSAVCAPDLILLDGDFSLSPAVPPRVRLVHSMPGRKEAMVIEGTTITTQTFIHTFIHTVHTYIHTHTLTFF